MTARCRHETSVPFRFHDPYRRWRWCDHCRQYVQAVDIYAKARA